jgi:hypothetical protein
MINRRYFLGDSPLTNRQIEAIYFAAVQRNPALLNSPKGGGVTLEIFRRAIKAVASRNRTDVDPLAEPVKAIVAAALTSAQTDLMSFAQILAIAEGAA